MARGTEGCGGARAARTDAPAPAFSASVAAVDRTPSNRSGSGGAPWLDDPRRACRVDGARLLRALAFRPLAKGRQLAATVTLSYWLCGSRFGGTDCGPPFLGGGDDCPSASRRQPPFGPGSFF